MRIIDADAFEKYAWSNPDIEVDGEPYISPSAVQNFAADHQITIDPPNEPLTCDGCAEIGKWENEYEYGYPSPCTLCKRRAWDNYRCPPEGEKDT